MIFVHSFQSQQERGFVDYTAEDIRDFLWRARTPLVGQLKWKTKKYYDEYRPLVIAFYDVDWGLDIVRSKFYGKHSKYLQLQSWKYGHNKMSTIWKVGKIFKKLFR